MRLRGLDVAKPTDPLRKFTELYLTALKEELGRPVLTLTRWLFGTRCAKPVCMPVNGYGRVFRTLNSER